MAVEADFTIALDAARKLYKTAAFALPAAFAWVPAMISIRDATLADIPRILDITNEAIANTTAVWNMTPATLDARTAWFNERCGRGFPVIVAFAKDAIIGFASFGDYRPFEGYLHTVEHSLYVDPKAQGQGAGKLLLSALIERAAALGKHAMVAGIEAGNAVSIGLHARAGFVEVGRLPEVGRKFDRWLDLVFMQKLLALSAHSE